jgi:hypothetical protein
MDEWPFADPKNVAVITLWRIMRDGDPILHVFHHVDDGAWTFLGWEDFCEEDAMIVGLSEIVEYDPSVAQLADLPLGWHAWRRSVRDPWEREPDPSDSETQGNADS